MGGSIRWNYGNKNYQVYSLILLDYYLMFPIIHLYQSSTEVNTSVNSWREKIPRFKKQKHKNHSKERNMKENKWSECYQKTQEKKRKKWNQDQKKKNKEMIEWMKIY